MSGGGGSEVVVVACGGGSEVVVVACGGVDVVFVSGGVDVIVVNVVFFCFYPHTNTTTSTPQR